MWAGATLLGCDGSASEMDAGELRSKLAELFGT